MKGFLGLGALLLGAAAVQLTYMKNSPGEAVSLKVTTKSGARNKIAPFLHGLFFEDINHSGDGGLYAELIRNRAFQGSDVTFGRAPNQRGSRIVSSEAEIPWAPTLTAWRPIGGAILSTF